MGRIFISAGHGAGDPGAVAGGTTEAQEMILLRDQIVPELRSRGFEVLSAPDDQSPSQKLSWINARTLTGDVAIEIHADAYENPGTRGATVFYIAGNTERKNQADILLLALLRRLPQLPNRGAKPDTATGTGRVAFCRQVSIPSLLMEVGFLTNPDDRLLLQSRRHDIALGIADGLIAWSQAVSGTQPPSRLYPAININLNSRPYSEKGIALNGNSYVPIDLADRLGIDLKNASNVRRIQYQGVVYIKAIDLRDFHISVSWDSSTSTVILRSNLPISPDQIDKIMGNGNTTEVQLIMFLKANNENALSQFPDLPKLYREEANIEGVNYDTAFCQMCVETNFLRFSAGDIKPSQNNFAGLGGVGGGSESATFPSARIGVRAHIQHLKAYASLEPLVQELVDPRFRFVTRGVAPSVEQLSGRWAADLQYGDKIIATVKRLYESARLI